MPQSASATTGTMSKAQKEIKAWKTAKQAAENAATSTGNDADVDEGEGEGPSVLDV